MEILKAAFDQRRFSLFLQAGLLTYGSSWQLRLPNKVVSGKFAAVVTIYSGGPVPDLHRVPFSPLSGNLKHLLVYSKVAAVSRHLPTGMPSIMKDSTQLARFHIIRPPNLGGIYCDTIL